MISCLAKMLLILNLEAPHFTEAEKKELGELVCEHSPKPLLSLAIAKAESSFKRNQVNKSGDYGIFQINKIHIKGEPELLLGDWPRQVKKHSKILGDAIKAGDWAYYHSRTPRFREAYRKKVDTNFKKFSSYLEKDR